MHHFPHSQQLQFFDERGRAPEPINERPMRNPEVEQQIHHFLTLWVEAEKPTKRTVQRTVSSLRSLARRSETIGGPSTPLELAKRPDVTAAIARSPGRVWDKTVSTWLQSMKDFIRIMIEPTEIAEQLLEEIDALLIPRAKSRWIFADSTGGGRGRGRDRRLLSWVDLMAIIERAGEGKAGELAMRDRAIMGLCCGSPLRIQEIADLRWESLDWHPEGEVKLFPVWATVERRGSPIQLPIYFRVVPSLIALRDIHQGLDGGEPAGAIFREVRDPFSGLKYRRVKSIFDNSVASAGFRGASLLDLKAAFADQLMHTHKISEQLLTGLLGYALHDSTLDLIREHKIWRLNRARSDKAAQPEESSRAPG